MSAPCACLPASLRISPLHCPILRLVRPCLQTYTMLGDLPDCVGEAGEQLPLTEGCGLIPRTLTHLFARIAELEGARRAGRQVSFTCSASLLEIYQEQVGWDVGGGDGVGGWVMGCVDEQKALIGGSPAMLSMPHSL